MQQIPVFLQFATLPKRTSITILEITSVVSYSHPWMHFSRGHDSFTKPSMLLLNSTRNAVQLTAYLSHEAKLSFSRGIAKVFLSFMLKFAKSGTSHQWSGTSAMNNWLKAQNPHGKQAGKHTNQSILFWYKPNSPTCGRKSSKSNGSYKKRNKNFINRSATLTFSDLFSLLRSIFWDCFSTTVLMD